MRKDLYQSILNAQKNNVDTESGIPTQSRRVYGRPIRQCRYENS